MEDKPSCLTRGEMRALNEVRGRWKGRHTAGVPKTPLQVGFKPKERQGQEYQESCYRLKEQGTVAHPPRGGRGGSGLWAKRGVSWPSISIFRDDSAKPGGLARPPLSAERLVHATAQLVCLIGNRCVYDPRPLAQKEEGIIVLLRFE